MPHNDTTAESVGEEVIPHDCGQQGVYKKSLGTCWAELNMLHICFSSVHTPARMLGKGIPMKVLSGRRFNGRLGSGREFTVLTCRRRSSDSRYSDLLRVLREMKQSVLVG